MFSLRLVATITVSRLEPDTAYTFVVTSFNGVGQSETFAVQHRTLPSGKHFVFLFYRSLPVKLR